jgi:hypothetical protein
MPMQSKEQELWGGESVGANEFAPTGGLACRQARNAKGLKECPSIFYPNNAA